MISVEETLLGLLNEFLLVSINHSTNPVKLTLFSHNHEILNNRLQDLTLKIYNVKKEELHLLDSKEILLTFEIINEILLIYYNSNCYYFNYKSSKNIFKRNDTAKELLTSFNDLHFLLINIEGFFLVHSDLHKTKDLIFKNYIVKTLLNNDELSFKTINQTENHFKGISKILTLIFDEIEYIESLIIAHWTAIPSECSSHYIISNKEIVENSSEILVSNSQQLEDWNNLFPGIKVNKKSKINFSDLPLSIDTSFFSNESNNSIFKSLDLPETDNNESINGIAIKSENYRGLSYLKQFFNNTIDCIYIDPPYNTGSKDFLYDDAFHSNHYYWFMENRISLAFELLKDTGIIFISIDDNELVNMRKILDKGWIFVGMYVWHKKTQPSFLHKELISVTEYILVYKKSSAPIKMKGGLTDPHKHTELLNISNDVCKRILPKNNTIIYDSGNRYTGFIEKGTYGNNKLQVTLEQSVNVYDGVPDIDVKLQGKFRWTQNKIDGISDENRNIVIKSLKTLRPTVTGSGKSKIRPPISLLSKKVNDIPTNTDGNFEMKNLFKIPPFYYPKPGNLIKFLIDSVTYNNPEAIILDFFAGSGTTAEAVIELNRQDNGKRKFIVIEEADYFDSILIPRIKKILFTNNWLKGIPLDKNYCESLIKVIRF